MQGWIPVLGGGADACIIVFARFGAGTDVGVFGSVATCACSCAVSVAVGANACGTDVGGGGFFVADPDDSIGMYVAFQFKYVFEYGLLPIHNVSSSLPSPSKALGWRSNN